MNQGRDKRNAQLAREEEDKSGLAAQPHSSCGLIQRLHRSNSTAHKGQALVGSFCHQPLHVSQTTTPVAWQP